jgi:hypothetical protein
MGSDPNNVWYDRNWISVVMVGVIYLIDEWYYLLTLLLVMVYVFFFNSSIISNETTIMVVGLSLFFELFKTMFVFSYDEDTFILKTYQEQIERINSDVLSYASFLDSFSKRYVESKDYQHALNQGVETIINNYCNVCYKRDECFKKNKGKIHSLFKDLLLYGTKNDFESLADYKHIWGQEVEAPKIIIENINVSKDNLALMKGTTMKIIPSGQPEIDLIKFKVSEQEYETLYSEAGCVTITVLGVCERNTYNNRPQLIIKDYVITNRCDYYF